MLHTRGHPSTPSTLTEGANLLREPRVISDDLAADLDEYLSFRHVQAELGAVLWPNSADLAPDAMYDAIRVSGRGVVE